MTLHPTTTTMTTTTPTPRQTFALFCATGKDWRNRPLTQEQVSAMLTACQAVRGNKPAALALCEQVMAGMPVDMSTLPPTAPSHAAIYKEAHAAGKAAMDACKPIPMIIPGYAPVMGGVCGFASVVFIDGRNSFVKWCIAKGHISKGRKSIWAGFEIGNQSLAIKEAYCAAFANVCNGYGIACRMDSRID